jgi:diacylglycerol kinase (ATP)
MMPPALIASHPPAPPNPTLEARSAVLDSRLVRVPILANLRAGASDSRAAVLALEQALRRERLSPILCWRREELSSVIESSRDDVRCVVAAGGDGTLMEVLNRAPGLPVAVLPLGNENLVAGYWGVRRRSGIRLARLIAAGFVRILDLGAANGRLFCLMASAGLDAEVVARLHRHRRGHVNHFSYASPLVRTLYRYRSPPIDVEILDTGERLRGSMVVVFNLPKYALGLPLAPDATAEDGWLDVCVLERPGVVNLLRYATAAVRHQLGELPDVHRRRVRAVRLSAVEPVPLQADGDPAGMLPRTIRVVPASMRLVLPQP